MKHTNFRLISTLINIRQCQRQRTKAGAKAVTADMLTVTQHNKKSSNSCISG
jgi:hypothetical protein